MCGICGEIRFDGQPIDPKILGTITDKMAPRGPDGSGLYIQRQVGFGHRRLKVIDLSEASHQPMIDSELGLMVVFNGIIYNFKELRSQLIKKGYRFFSQGDTEVVLKAYHAWGSEFVHRLQGMFAIAIWDRKKETLVLVRDRLGIKPLYYTEARGCFRFASSLPALLTSGQVDTSINPIALHLYMSFHAVVPPPHTIYQGIHKLPPGTLMTIDSKGKRHQETYWTLSFPESHETSSYDIEEWQDRLMESLKTSVKRRLVSDVPVGVLLSGGLDSSLIVALLHELGQKHLNTFSVGFEDAGGEKGNEFNYSDAIARKFETDHHQIFVKTSEALPALRECVGAMSEPMVSHDNIGFYLLSREVSKHLKVVQSGQGADEVFGGYFWYPPLMHSKNPVDDYTRQFVDRDHEEYSHAIHHKYISRDYSREFIESRFSKTSARHPVDKALWLDTTVMLVDDPVKRVDNMTMAWGLEARVPFLDHELVELAAQIPPELKVQNGGKYILKETARRCLPSMVIDRPKGYFPVPALKYLQGEYLEFVKEIFSQTAAKQRSLFKKDHLDLLFKNPEQHITPLRGSKLWQMGLLELWLQTHE